MTNLVYFSKIYKAYSSSPNIITEVDTPIIEGLINACNSDDLFIYSTWFEVDENLRELISKKPKRAVIYSGMDWHDVHVRKEAHDYVKENVDEVLYIGNTDGPGYFSYWLFFIEQKFTQYSLDSITPKNIENLYMCLNRKRHIHRVQLVRKLKEKNLFNRGLVTLGGDTTAGIEPIVLKDEITVTAGDDAVGNKREGIPNDITSLGNLKHWNNHLVNIVTETTEYTETFISEKTWKPIIGKRPFMILGDRNIYKHLKEYGIDTYDDIFGDGYKLPLHMDRINWICSSLRNLENVDLNKMYINLEPRLEANRQRLKEIFNTNKKRYNSILNLLGTK